MLDRISAPTPRAWAKLENGSFLALGDHGTDVVAVMAALLAGGWAERLARCSSGAFGQNEIERLLVATFLHDMGKTNAGFWRRFDDSAPRVGHLRPLWALGVHDRLRRSLEPLIETIFGVEGDLFSAMLAHHGRPVTCEQVKADDGCYWEPLGDYDPIEELDALIATARGRWPRAFEAEPSSFSPRAVSLFAGLLTLADWIGSAPERFAIDNVTGAERVARSRTIAEVAARNLGLVVDEELRRKATEATFESVFGFSPTPLQVAAGEPGADPLVVLEAETGSGKTEAALWRFVRSFARGDVDALYFALPTRTSASQIEGRVQKCMDAVFGEGVVPVALALPGYMRVGGIEGKRLGRFDVLWPDDPGDELRDARWAAEAPKQFLAARAAVGTIDQALLAGLRVRHAHFRAACLSRALLVIDEAHASDVFMTELSAQVLDNHLAAGGQAMLLSATLGSTAKARLTQDRSKETLPLEMAAQAPYPSLTGVAPPSNAVRGVAHSKRIDIELVGAIDDPSTLAALATAAARNGARVLVLRNTVAGAIALQEQVETLPEAKGLLWSVAGAPALHHGRFAAEDRRLLDREIETAFGKERPTGGLIAVGTQTLEISLDLDADFMVTDLAPIDVVLQRAGRLHRHRARTRPPGFETPRLVVATPSERDLSPYLGKVRNRHGLGPANDAAGGVYPVLAVLEATWAELERRDALELPRDNRELVERATHPDALNAIEEDQGWSAHSAKRMGARSAEITQARHWTLDLSTPFAELEPFPEEERVTTRLGGRDLLLALPDGVIGPFGGPIVSLRVPGWMARDVKSDAEIVVERFDSGLRLELANRETGSSTFRYDRFGLRSELRSERETL